MLACIDWALTVCQCTRHSSNCCLCFNSWWQHHGSTCCYIFHFIDGETEAERSEVILSQVTQMTRGRVGIWILECGLLPIIRQEHSNFPLNTASCEEWGWLFQRHYYFFYLHALELFTKWLVLSKIWELKVIVCQRWKYVLYSLSTVANEWIYWLILILGIKGHTKNYHKEEPEILS